MQNPCITSIKFQNGIPGIWDLKNKSRDQRLKTLLIMNIIPTTQTTIMIHQQYGIMIHPETRGKESFQLDILRIKPGWSYSDINSKINLKAIFKQV